jgi:hypothetical protein
MIKTKKNRNSKSNKKISKISKRKIKFTNKNFKRNLKGGSTSIKSLAGRVGATMYTGKNCTDIGNGLATAKDIISACSKKINAYAFESQDEAKNINDKNDASEISTIEDRYVTSQKYDYTEEHYYGNYKGGDVVELTDQKNNRYLSTLPKFNESKETMKPCIIVKTAFPEILQINNINSESTETKISFTYPIKHQDNSEDYLFETVIPPNTNTIKISIPLIVHIIHSPTTKSGQILSFKFNGKKYYTISSEGQITKCQICNINKKQLNELKAIENVTEISGDNIKSLKADSTKKQIIKMGSEAYSSTKSALSSGASALLSGSKSAASFLGKGMGLVKSNSSRIEGKTIQTSNTQANKISGQLAEVINKLSQDKIF